MLARSPSSRARVSLVSLSAGAAGAPSSPRRRDAAGRRRQSGAGVVVAKRARPRNVCLRDVRGRSIDLSRRCGPRGRDRGVARVRRA